MFELLLAGYIGLQTADTAISLQRVGQPGYREANPIMAPLVAHPPAAIAVKAAVTAGTAWALHDLKRSSPRAAWWMVVGVNVGYSVIVWHNLRQ
jgi:hypothetical protein